MKAGDIIFAREHFMRMYSEFASRRFIIKEVDSQPWFNRLEMTIENADDSTQIVGGQFEYSDFYFFDDISINKDILDTLDRYEFQSFQGVTLEGKIVQLDLPVPNKKKLSVSR